MDLSDRPLAEDDPPPKHSNGCANAVLEAADIRLLALLVTCFDCTVSIAALYYLPFAPTLVRLRDAL